jgi:putative ABC transport system ATP-binding protein
VAIARALINRPAIVLGDEPTGSLNTQTSQELVGLMRWLDNVTFVILTHDLDPAGQPTG